MVGQVASEVTVHQPRLAPFIRDELLTREELEKLRVLLVQNKALTISSNKVDDAGKFLGAQDAPTGNVWVRDSVYLALALYKSDTDGKGAKAASRVLGNVAKFFQKSASRFDDAISGRRQTDRSQRPSVRFDSSCAAAKEGEELWDEKQNSALGYFIWLRCRLCCEGKMPMTGNHLRLLGLMFEYLAAIEYWADEDAGHWEEAPKVEASSIGAVLASVKEFRKVLLKHRGMMAPIDDEILDMLEEKGQEALDEILPNECVQDGRERDVDSALLFLIYPLEIVGPEMARTIVQSVSDRLMGPIGIRRFNGDSYWCKDFNPAASSKEMTRSSSKSERGEEAQWSVFDPILSAIYGKFYMEVQDFEDLKMQQFHLGRSLAQITGDECQVGAWLCPESYYLSRGRWVPSDVCPLLWSQANLDIAMSKMHESLTQSSKEVKGEFQKYDTLGEGSITVNDLISVLVKLNPGLVVEDLKPFLAKFVSEGKLSFERLVDELFCGAISEPAKARWNLVGLRPPQGMSPVECCEVERVVTEVLGELGGEFEGEYYPLMNSNSYPFRMGGMTKAEKDELEESGYLFSAHETEGKGVWANVAKDMAVLVNSDAHVEVVVKPTLGDAQGAPKRLHSFEKVFRDMIQLSGYTFA